MKIYHVIFKLEGQGSYVPYDPVAGGNYYRDKHCEYYITAKTKKAVKQAVKTSHPAAKNIIISVMCEA